MRQYAARTKLESLFQNVNNECSIFQAEIDAIQTPQLIRPKAGKKINIFVGNQVAFNLRKPC